MSDQTITGPGPDTRTTTGPGPDWLRPGGPSRPTPPPPVPQPKPRPRETATPEGRPVERALTAFYAVVALVALTGQAGAAVTWLHWPPLAAIAAVAAVEFGGIVLSAYADHRRRLGEHALAARTLSAAVAAGAVAFNWLGHGDHLQGGFFAGMSALGYLVWLLHSGARRRDQLRAAGNLPPVAPVYGLTQWARHPALTRRARTLALTDPNLGLYGSLTAARSQARTERRQTAIAALLHRKLAAGRDRLAADIAVTVYDLDAIAARLAAAADYDGLTALLAADLTPDRITAPASPDRTGPDPTATTRPDATTPGPNPEESTDAKTDPSGPPRTQTRPTAPRPARPRTNRARPNQLAARADADRAAFHKLKTHFASAAGPPTWSQVRAALSTDGAKCGEHRARRLAGLYPWPTDDTEAVA